MTIFYAILILINVPFAYGAIAKGITMEAAIFNWLAIGFLSGLLFTDLTSM